MLTHNSTDQTVFALINRTAGTVAATVQIYYCGQLLDASAIGDDVDTTLSAATRELVPSMSAIGTMSIADYLELTANTLKQLETF
jgi:hypothetical protein